MSNRRRTYGRHSVQLAGTVQPLEGAGASSRPLAAQIKDISLGGARFVVDREMPVGSLWKLSFRTSDGADHEKVLLTRSCSHTVEGFAVGGQYVVRPATLRAAGVDTQSIDDEIRDLLDDGSQPVWDALPDVAATDPLSVRSLSALTVCTDSDLTVTDSITDCTLDVYGRLIAPNAALLGGTAHVLRGASVGGLGSPDKTPTLLVLGQSLKTINMLAAAENELAVRQAAVDAKQRAASLIGKGNAQTMSHADRERMMLLPAELEELRLHHALMAENIRKLREGESAVRRTRLEIGKAIFPGVTIIAGNARVEFSAHVPGPTVLDLLPDGRFGVVPGVESAVPSIEHASTFLRLAA